MMSFQQSSCESCSLVQLPSRDPISERIIIRLQLGLAISIPSSQPVFLELEEVHIVTGNNLQGENSKTNLKNGCTTQKVFV